MRRAVIAVMLLVVATVCAQADTYIFKDVLKPHGQPRDMAAKLADGRACGSSGESFSARSTAKFTKCMRAHGWAIDHIVRDPHDRAQDDARDPVNSTVVHFDDLRKKPNGQWRGNGALQADTRRCGAHGRRDYESQVFIGCMAGLGWRHDHTHRAAPAVQINSGSSYSSWPDNSDPPPPPPPPPIQQYNFDVVTGQLLP
jgi:hypothetical protein